MVGHNMLGGLATEPISRQIYSTQGVHNLLVRAPIKLPMISFYLYQLKQLQKTKISNQIIPSIKTHQINNN